MNKWIVLTAGLLLFFCEQGLTQQFSYKKTAEGIEISENNKPVLFYQTKSRTVDGKYPRSGYVHPLYGLNGNVLTEDGPEDHPYHRGVFWAWHQIIANGKSVADGWISDKISFDAGKMQVTKSNKNLLLSSQVMWRVKDSITGTVTNLINEITRINVHAAKENYRAIDFDIHLKPLLDEVKLGGSDDPKGYGGFCLRIQLPENIRFISQGKDVQPQDTAVNAGPWMDFRTDSGGIVVFGYRNDSTAYPWILRKAKSMQNVPYPGRQPVVVPKEGWRLKYTILIHDSGLTDETIEELYQAFKKQ